MTADKDYVLGTHDEEIARLGLQHQVWRPYMLDAWARAGITRGSRVLDVGAGPGYATVDAAEIVGDVGEVLAIERSSHFGAYARRQLVSRQINWVRWLDADLMTETLPGSGFDFSWCRWVASFVSSPATLVAKVSECLRTGGRAIFHEYQDYATWRMSPANVSQEHFVQQVMASWRANGGEPDIAPTLVPLLTAAGFSIESIKPLVFAVRPRDWMWQWPASFVDSNSERLVATGFMKRAEADLLQSEFRRVGRHPDTVMVTPMVLEIIAQKT